MLQAISPFSHVFLSYISLKRENAALEGNGLNLHHTITTLNDPEEAENIVRKGENAGYQHFILFLHCFFTLSQTKIII